MSPGRDAPARHLPGHRLARDQRQITVALILTCAITAVLYAAGVARRPDLPAIWLASMAPVMWVSYHRRGLLYGAAFSAYFSTIFLGQALVLGGAAHPAQLVQVFATSLLLFLTAYIFSEIAMSFRDREALTGTLREREALLKRALDLSEVTAFLLNEATPAVDAAGASLLLRDVSSGTWRLICSGGSSEVVPWSDPGADHGLSIAQWLVLQDRIQIVNNLADDPRFSGNGELRSVLALPLRLPGAPLSGMLVALNKLGGSFTQEDAAALARLAEPAAHALTGAGAFARTDLALGRTISQLAAIEQSARELNRVLDPHAIAAEGLRCALEVTGAETGCVAVMIPDAGGGGRWTSVPPDFCAPEALAAEAAPLAAAASGAGAAPSDLAAQSRLLVPIVHDGDAVGVIDVRMTHAGSLGNGEARALSALAEHIALALTNARLLAEVRWERTRVDQILENMADGLLVTDVARRVKALNPAGERLLGWRADDALGRLACELLGCGSCSPSERAECRGGCTLGRALVEGSAASHDRWPLRRPDGTERMLALSIAPLPAGAEAPGGLAVLVRDVTAQEELERFQGELIAAFSHELRSPLTNINTLVELLLAQDVPIPADVSREHLELLRGQSRRLARFAERTLDVARLDADRWRLRLRPVPASLAAEEAVRRWRDQVPDRAFEFLAPARSPWVWADEEALAITLDNLIDNAVKYSKADSVVTVSVEVGPRGSATLAVQDRGPGIPAEVRERVFQRFVRADGRDSQRVYGHGLGLYIARRLVEAQGGTIWVDAPPEGGSRFAFALPLRSGDQHEDPSRRR